MEVNKIQIKEQEQAGKQGGEAEQEPDEKIIEPLSQLLEKTTKYKEMIIEKERQEGKQSISDEEIKSKEKFEEDDIKLNNELENILNNNTKVFNQYNDDIDTLCKSKDHQKSAIDKEKEIVNDTNSNQVNKQIIKKEHNKKKHQENDENDDEDDEDEEMNKFFLKNQKQKDNNRYFDDLSNKTCNNCNEKGHLSSSCLKKVVVKLIIIRHVIIVLEIIEEKSVNQWFALNAESKDIWLRIVPMAKREDVGIVIR